MYPIQAAFRLTAQTPTVTLINTETPSDSAVAMHRFGYGASADDIASARRDPRAWVQDQLGVQHSTVNDLPSSQELLQATQSYRELSRMARRQHRGRFNDHRRAALQQLAVARAQQTIFGIAPFVERLFHFWCNHFAVSAAKDGIHYAALSRENEAIRPNMRSTFAELLIAFVRHPTTLVFLDNERSVGRNARAANARTAGPVNENLAREVLELHTLGVDCGYTQTDVIQLAKALTGWSIGGLVESDDPETIGRFVFREDFHEPGHRSVLGKTYPDTGVHQATDILIDLALHPSTERHIAAKLCRHFLSDAPPPAVVNSVAGVFRDTQGSLPAIYSHLAANETLWSSPLTKYKTPEEYCYSALRTLNVDELNAHDLVAYLHLMGQPVGIPPSPKGWSDQREDYRGGGTFLRRMELAWRLAEIHGAGYEPAQLYQEAYPGLVDDRVHRVIQGAESRTQALAVFLLSPQFLQR